MTTTTTIAVPTSCAALCTKLAELTQHMPKGDVRGLCRGLARDVTAMRAQRPDLKVAYLTDGATEFETLYQHLKTPLGPDAVSLVDFWHAAEYLGAAARVFESKRKAKPGQFRRWRHALKHDEGAAAQIIEQLEQSGLETVMLDGVRPVEAAIRYFRARLERMDYAGARRQGLPIGSGNVEATCKNLRAEARNGSDEDRCRKAGFCNEVTALEPHPPGGVWIQYCDGFAAVTCGSPG